MILEFENGKKVTCPIATIMQQDSNYLRKIYYCLDIKFSFNKETAIDIFDKITKPEEELCDKGPGLLFDVKIYNFEGKRIIFYPYYMIIFTNKNGKKWGKKRIENGRST